MNLSPSDLGSSLTLFRKKPVPPIKEMTQPMSARRPRVKPCGFRIDGQGYSTTKLDYDLPADGSAAAGNMATSLPVPSGPSPEAGDDSDGSGNDCSVNPLLVQQLLGINRTLEKQIETLRLRLDFDHKHHEAQKQAVMVESGQKVAEKTDEIKKLTEQITLKDSRLDTLTEANDRKAAEIAELKKQLETLTKDVESAKTYADDLVGELAILTEEKQRLETGASYEDKDREITALKSEIDELKSNLSVLEKELQNAKEAMASQSSRMRFMENDRKNIQLKFKEELAKVTQSMRLEVEKMRDVMRKQWEEMRFLREQNTSMGRDIKDIRNLLVGGSLDDDAKLNESVISPVPQSAQPSNRGRSYYSMSALKPSLPVLSKENKRVLTARKK